MVIIELFLSPRVEERKSEVNKPFVSETTVSPAFVHVFACVFASVYVGYTTMSQQSKTSSFICYILT